MFQDELCVVTTVYGEIDALTSKTTFDIGDSGVGADEARLYAWRNGDRDLTVARLRAAADEINRLADDLELAGPLSC